MYNGYHSIDIYLSNYYDESVRVSTPLNTWDTFHMVAEKRPYIAPPEPKYEYIDVPGRDGSLDYTQSLSGYPNYNNRTGSWDFIIVNDFYEPVDTYEAWFETYSKVMAAIQGKIVIVVLEDDLSYYYKGRLHVSGLDSERNYSKLTIDYNLEPYKRYIYTTLDTNWLWDPFSFVNGVIPQEKYKNIFIPSWHKDANGYYMDDNYTTNYIYEEDLGSAPDTPLIKGVTFPDPRCGSLYIKYGLSKIRLMIPGWSNLREYGSEMASGVRIPEYTFRRRIYSTGGSSEYIVGGIKAANRESKSVPNGLFTEANMPSNYNTCENCGTDFVMGPASTDRNFTVNEAGVSELKIICKECNHVKTFQKTITCPTCGVSYANATIAEGLTYYTITCSNGHATNYPYVPDIGYMSYEFRRGEF